MTGFLTTPLGWILLGGLGLTGLRFLRSWKRDRKSGQMVPRRFFWPFFSLWLLTMVFSMPQVARWVAGPLEDGIGKAPLPLWTDDAAPEVIVVLGGGLGGPPRPGVPLSHASGERLFAALVAAKTWPEASLLFSGRGHGERAVSSASRMVEEAIRLGVDSQRILIDEQARTTQENAFYCAAEIRRKGFSRVALVTSAIHMPRARDAFWRTGVVTLPVQTPVSSREGWGPGLLLPDVRALTRSTLATHEWLGLAWYKSRGWIGAPYADAGDIKGTPADGDQAGD